MIYILTPPLYIYCCKVNDKIYYIAGKNNLWVTRFREFALCFVGDELFLKGKRDMVPFSNENLETKWQLLNVYYPSLIND